MSNQVPQLWMGIEAVIADVEGWYLSRNQKRLRVFLKPLDRVRLLRLKVWAVKYYLPVSEILDIIYPRLISRIERKSKKKTTGLGMRIASLTGQEAKRLLEDGIKERYLDGEHKAVWRERERASQLAVEQLKENDGLSVRSKSTSFIEAESVEAFLTAYDKDISRQQEMDRVVGKQKWRRRKNYRFSPWR